MLQLLLLNKPVYMHNVFFVLCPFWYAQCCCPVIQDRDVSFLLSQLMMLMS